ncbi:MAG TPA: hypothetical protein VFZ61_07370, partial [Polyangiales bacterium]
MLGQRAKDPRRLMALGVGLALNLVACGEDAVDVEDSGTQSPPPGPAQGSDGAAPGPGPTGTADATSPVVVGTDAGTSSDAGANPTPTMDGSVTIITPIEPKPDAGSDDASVVAPVDASGPAPDGGPPRWSTREDLGKGDGKDVVTIGDSWMAGILGGSGIQAALDREGTNYRQYAVTATTL